MKKLVSTLCCIAYILLATTGARLQAQSTPGTANSNFALYMSEYPGGLSGMIETADLVVIGTIEEIVDEFLFYGYDTDMIDQYRKMEEELQTTLSLPFADYRVSVEEILMNKPDGHLMASSKVEAIDKQQLSLVFRKIGNEPTNLGMEMMLFLSINPDGKTYGVGSVEGQLNLTDSPISYYNPSNQELEFPRFSKNLDVEGLRELVKNTASRLNLQ